MVMPELGFLDGKLGFSEIERVCEEFGNEWRILEKLNRNKIGKDMRVLSVFPFGDS